MASGRASDRRTHTDDALRDAPGRKIYLTLQGATVTALVWASVRECPLIGFVSYGRGSRRG